MQVKILKTFALAILGWACYATLRLALADHRYRANTLPDLTRAVELDPANSRAWLWLAEHQEHASVDPTSALRTAARLSPFSSAALTRLGLHAELDGQGAEAERLLLQAASIDKLFEPRWSLVNFYFRAGNWQEFWRWVTSALDMGYGDLSPLYRLCWRASNDPAMILNHIPQRQSVLASYLGFLLSSGRSSDAAAAARRLSNVAAPDDVPLVLASLDQSLDVATWNTLCERRLLPYSPLDPDRGPYLTNADFRNPPLLHGFDWHVTNTPEIAASRVQPSGLRLVLSGKQPESCELLSQPVRLAFGRRYRFRFEYQTTGIAPNTGLRWSMGEQMGSHLSSEAFTAGSVDFVATAPITKLTLSYQRVPGTARIAGAVLLGNLSIEQIP